MTMNVTSESVTMEDNTTVAVLPCVCYEDFSKLPSTTQTWLMFSDWSLWAIITSVLGAIMITAKVDKMAGFVTFNVMIVMSWIGGFIGIFIPAALILTELTMIVVSEGKFWMD